jgi:polyhydroxyalkanoate synthesis repressor PhaR
MDDLITLKKYPNRRLYDTRHSAYVTLDDVAKLIKDGFSVEVMDAKSQQNVTGAILTQIIMEQTKKNNALLPISLLHLIIRFGEDLLSEFFEKYLEQSIRSYLSYKKSMEEQFRICLELGIDLSTLTEQTFRHITPFFPWGTPQEGKGGDIRADAPAPSQSTASGKPEKKK